MGRDAAAPSLARPAGLWERLSARLAEPRSAEPLPATTRATQPRAADVWQALADHLDLGAWVPVPTPGVEVTRLESRRGDPYYVLRSPAPR